MRDDELFLNPYSAPAAWSDAASEHVLRGMYVRHRSFVGRTIYWGFKGLNYYREQIRQQAEEFINTEVGLENVLTVCEHVTSNGPFSVVVWYRLRQRPTAGQADFAK